MTAVLYGVGVGPGDPELITVKALKAITRSEVLCYIINDVGRSVAYDIVKSQLDHIPVCMPVKLPMKTERRMANLVYNETADNIKSLVSTGKSVAMICEGDPFYYASFSYVFQRLADSCPVEIIPGISCVHAAAARIKRPLCQQTDKQAVVTARNSDAEIISALQGFETVVILKAGTARHRIKILASIHAPDSAVAYIANVGCDNEYIETDMNRLPQGAGGYFSMFIIQRRKAID